MTIRMRIFFGAMVTLFGLLTTIAYADDNVGTVIMARGEVTALQLQQDVRVLKRRSPVYMQDTVTTGNNSKVQIRFNDDALLALNANSSLVVHQYQQQATRHDQPEVVMQLIEGGFRTLTGSLGKGTAAAYRVDTPVGSIGIRGTLYSALLDKGRLLLGVWQGTISITTDAGDFVLGHDADFHYASVDADGFTGLLEAPAELQDNTAEQPQSTPNSNQHNTSADANIANIANSDVPPPLDQQDSARLQAILKASVNSETDPDANPDTPPIDDSSPDSRLTNTEYQAFLSSHRLGAVAMNGELRVGTVVQLDGEQPLFVAVNEAGQLDVVRFSGISSKVDQPDNNLDVIWGVWDGSDSDIEVYSDRDSDEHSGYDGMALWLHGTPTLSSQLSSLSGSVHFAGNLGIGFNNLGQPLSVSGGQFDLDFNTGRVSNGSLSAGFGDTGADLWAISFDGSIQIDGNNSPLVNLDIMNGQHGDIGINTGTSELGGILVGEQADAFLGGFELIDNSSNSATGAVLWQHASPN